MCQLGLGDIIFFKRVRVLLKEVVPVSKVIHTTTSSRYYWWKTNIKFWWYVQNTFLFKTYRLKP